MRTFTRIVFLGALSAAIGLSIACGGTNEGGGGSVTATGDPTPATDNANAAIAAAQTADGQAIPQGAGPNGACPQVLVMLGFWSCPTLGQTCSYSAIGVAHSCACDRTDGEGQSASWVCDQ